MRRPAPRIVFRHPAHFIALGGGVGLAPFAPGTFGTLVAFPLFWALDAALTPLTFVVVLAILFAIGVWACSVTGRALGHADHPSLVWDEIVAFLAVLFFTPRHGYWPALAFLLFRLFDIAKPPPIRYYERTVKGGLGAMIDDLIAALYALLVLAFVRTLIGW